VRLCTRAPETGAEELQHGQVESAAAFDLSAWLAERLSMVQRYLYEV
jgi:hypothetical protein